MIVILVDVGASIGFDGIVVGISMSISILIAIVGCAARFSISMINSLSQSGGCAVSSISSRCCYFAIRCVQLVLFAVLEQDVLVELCTVLGTGMEA